MRPQLVEFRRYWKNFVSFVERKEPRLLAFDATILEQAGSWSRLFYAAAVDARRTVLDRLVEGQGPGRGLLHVESRPQEGATESVAELLRRYRLNAGLTQQALADRAGISVRAISDLERGIRCFPYPDTVHHLVKALGVGGTDRALLETAAVRLDWRFQTEPNPKTDEAPATPHNLPVQFTSFVGRAHETAEICRELERTRLLTLLGTGGVGKTRLALLVAEHQLRLFRDGV
jgi:transcriptional regulator with XRE-family HTH domain